MSKCCLVTTNWDDKTMKTPRTKKKTNNTKKKECYLIARRVEEEKERLCYADRVFRNVTATNVLLKSTNLYDSFVTVSRR